jgi:hypothetical protein
METWLALANAMYGAAGSGCGCQAIAKTGNCGSGVQLCKQRQLHASRGSCAGKQEAKETRPSLRDAASSAPASCGAKLMALHKEVDALERQQLFAVHHTLWYHL